ncbi:MAG: GrpB family protein [Sporocytophaga sp.]|uniref:GrpB family protein n=1 Tax=Sporocytophaga sp. TaxID=2231183 RepID=UPI001B10D597|nr:GrpB family protein [Sporocytophaga sp.]MBO9702644.1 GrpB family protein [Sporocytophaga sp.]
MKVELQLYNQNWRNLFKIEKELISSAIQNPDIHIEHIGSTSIEGLSAKPIIDILIGVPDFSKVNDLISPIETCNYSYISIYEDAMPYRRYFTKSSEDKRTHQIHMVELNSPFWIRHLAFRNYLRDHQEEKEAYNLLKSELSEKDWDDINDYAQAKTEFIRAVEYKAGIREW